MTILVFALIIVFSPLVLVACIYVMLRLPIDIIRKLH
jgi:hypothetical protein